MTCKHIWADQTRLKLKHHSRLETGRIRILYGQYQDLARTQARSTLTLSKTDLGRPLKLETNLCFGWKKLKDKMGKTRYQFRNWLKYEDKIRKKREKGNVVNFQEVAGCEEKCPSYAICHWLLRGHMTADTISTMKLFPAKISKRATLQNLWRHRVTVHRYPRIGTLGSNDADGNENVKKTIGLISKTTTSHVHHAFLYVSLRFLHDYDVTMSNLAFYGGRKQATTKFYFSFWAWILSLEIQLQEGSPTFDKVSE